MIVDTAFVMVEMQRRSVIIRIMNTLKRYAGTCAILVLAGIIVFGASTAMGQSKTPQPPEIKEGLPWMAVVYSLVALAGICVIAFKNPKRTQSH